jgi:hypothetical protein
MDTTRQNLECPGVLDSVVASMNHIFRYMFVFAASLIGALALPHLHIKNRNIYVQSKVAVYGSDCFSRVTFYWICKVPLRL